ncbi:DUF933 domain-containing protein [Singulisphaera sp. GP187]|uniref:DUF933 domain-containing protein n=1 Tax=Singulisphaera sp. GP187 TaxID=1882752 RepID=UPI0009FA4C64|nr:DUF933 domain-containing protein [Singulisphaera sp. GP187]
MVGSEARVYACEAGATEAILPILSVKVHKREKTGALGHSLGLATFTAGEPDVRGWNLERGGSAVDAAGKIHTDLAKGFIRAEVTAFDDLARLGTMKEVKAKNLGVTIGLASPSLPKYPI